MASVGGIAMSPKSESRHELATFLWKNRQVAKDHPYAAITLSSMGLQSYMHEEFTLAA